MKGFEDIERSLARLQVTAGAGADEHILSDTFAALEASFGGEAVGREPGVWQAVLASRMAKIAVAAAVMIVGAVLVVSILTGPEPQPAPPAVAGVTEEQIRRVTEMVAAGDVEGLIGMLDEEPFERKVLAAICLGEMGDRRALPKLRQLYLLAGQKLPEGYMKNPFAGPIGKIEERLRRRPEGELAPDVNAVGKADVNEAVEDVNEAVEDVNGALVPAIPEEGLLELLVVSKETGWPLEGVQLDIKVQREGPDDLWEQVTDESGQCTIDINDSNTSYVQIDVSKERFVPMQLYFRRGEETELIELPISYTLALEPGTSIGGFVQNEEGEPIKRASVFVRLPRRGGDRVARFSVDDYEVKTDAVGFWRCDVIPGEASDVSLRLSHPDYVDDDEDYGAVDVPTMERLRRMIGVMVMTRGVPLVGRVLDWQGRPIAGADVSQSSRWRRPYATIRTRTDGSFEFPHTRLGEAIITVQAEGCAPDLKAIMVREEMAPVEFSLGPPQTIRARVVDANGKPISGASVSVGKWRGYSYSIKWNSETGADGCFEWKQAPKDEVLFYIGKQGYVSAYEVPLSAGLDQHVIVLYPPLRVRGYVLDADGNTPVKRFKVTPGFASEGSDRVAWQNHRAVEFANARFEFEFPAGWHGADGCLIRIEADGYLPGISRIFYSDEGEVVFNFRLQKGEGVSGVVYIPEGEPAEAVKVVLCTRFQYVKLMDGQFMDRQGLLSVETGPDGRLYFPPQREEYLLVAVADEGFAKVTDEEFESTGSMTLEPWGRVEGVVRIGGEAPAYEEVFLSSKKKFKSGIPDVYYQYRAVTDAEGGFVFDKVPAGTVDVAFRRKHAGAVAYSLVEPVEVVAGSTVTVSLGDRGRPVVGRISVPPGYEGTANWASATAHLALKPPEPPTPEGFDQMTEQDKHAWYEKWRESDEGKASERAWRQESKYYSLHISHDASFRVESLPAGEYELYVQLWERGKDMSYGWELGGSLFYELEVRDVNESLSDVPLDIGTIELQISKGLEVGDVAEPFELDGFEGEKISLLEYRGRTVLLSLWSTQETFSSEKLLQVEQIYRSFGKQEQLVMIAVCLDDEAESGAQFVNENKLGCISGFANEGTREVLQKEYGLTKTTISATLDRLIFPCVLVIGPNGRVLARNPTVEELEAVLEEVLGIE